MNWTGGRLRRLSNNRPGTISNAQKEHFAKARLNYREKCRRDSLPLIDSVGNTVRTSFIQNTLDPASHPFNNINGAHHLDESPRRRESSPPLPNVFHYSERNEGVTHRDVGSSDPERYNIQSSETFEYPQSVSLNSVKSRLLQQDDWLSLSLNRPLQMNFASTEQKHNVGKRRRLTKINRARQFDNICKRFSVDSPPCDYTPRVRRIPLQSTATPDPNGVKITDHDPSSARQNGSQGLGESQESAESMLFDKVENPQREAGDAETPFSKLASIRFGSPTAGLSEIPGGHLTRTSVSKSYHSMNLGSRSVRPGLSPVEKVARKSLRPVHRRFTIDDQVQAEREGKLSSSLTSHTGINISSYNGEGTWQESTHSPPLRPNVLVSTTNASLSGGYEQQDDYDQDTQQFLSRLHPPETPKSPRYRLDSISPMVRTNGGLRKSTKASILQSTILPRRLDDQTKRKTRANIFFGQELPPGTTDMHLAKLIGLSVGNSQIFGPNSQSDLLLDAQGLTGDSPIEISSDVEPERTSAIPHHDRQNGSFSPLLVSTPTTPPLQSTTIPFSKDSRAHQAPEDIAEPPPFFSTPFRR